MKHTGRTLAAFLLTLALALGLKTGMNLAALGEAASGSESDIDTPLTLEAKTDGTIVVKHPMVGMQYSINGARTVVQSTDDITIDVTEGDSVQFFGKGTDITRYGDSDSAFNNRTKITGGTAQCYIYGNIMSLVDENGFSTARALTGYSAFAYLFENNGKLYNHDTRKLVLPATTLTEYCYCKMFSGCSALTAAPDLPAATLTKYCYFCMFADCTLLKAASRLDAGTLAANCCESMFSGCSSLTAAPDLPADSLAAHCYKSMFYRCSSLAAAPRLAARTLAANCYDSMFYLCSSLTAAPVLPAPQLAAACYRDMFKNCTKLNAVTCLATDITANNGTLDWLSNVSATGTFVKPPAMQSWGTDASGIPSGWKIENYNFVTGVTLKRGEAEVKNLDLTTGSNATLTAVVAPGDATDREVSWRSSDDSIATVENGLVTAVAPGSAIITATSMADSTRSTSCVVTVPSTYIVIIPAKLDVQKAGWNDSEGIRASGSLAAGKKLTVTASSDGEFALVNTDNNNDKIAYTLVKSGSESSYYDGTLENTTWVFDKLWEDAEIQSIGVVVEDYSTAAPGSEYIDTVTFTASVVDAP